MTLACKFNVDGMDAADSMNTTAGPYLSLSVEIEATPGCWREAKSCDLGMAAQKSIMDDQTGKNHVKSLCADGTLTWATV
eukprot:2653249-Prymnesium_polylepis.1